MLDDQLRGKPRGALSVYGGYGRSGSEDCPPRRETARAPRRSGPCRREHYRGIRRQGLGASTRTSASPFAVRVRLVPGGVERSPPGEVTEEVGAHGVPRTAFVPGSLRLRNPQVELRGPRRGPPSIRGLLDAVEQLGREAEPVGWIKRHGLGGDDVEREGHVGSVAPIWRRGDEAASLRGGRCSAWSFTSTSTRTPAGSPPSRTPPAAKAGAPVRPPSARPSPAS